MMWRGCIARDSNNKITTSFTCDYDGEDASSVSFLSPQVSPTRVKNFLQIFSLRTAAFSLITLALLHHRVGSPDLLAVVETLEEVLAKVGAFLRGCPRWTCTEMTVGEGEGRQSEETNRNGEGPL